MVGNSTALGVLVADALLDEGLELAGPPVDVGTAAPPEEFADAVARAIRDSPAESPSEAADPVGAEAAGGADALIAVFVPPIAIPGAAYARALREAVAGSGQAGGRGVPRRRGGAGRAGRAAGGRLARARVGAELPQPGAGGRGAGPGQPVRALAARPVGEFVSPPGVDTERARALVARLGAGHAHRAR